MSPFDVSSCVARRDDLPHVCIFVDACVNVRDCVRSGHDRVRVRGERVRGIVDPAEEVDGEEEFVLVSGNERIDVVLPSGVLEMGTVEEILDGVRGRLRCQPCSSFQLGEQRRGACQAAGRCSCIFPCASIC